MPRYVVEFSQGASPEDDGRLDAPAFHRNCQPIWAVLENVLRGQSGDVLELGSGTGQHVIEFARQSPGIRWWPSDINDQHLRSIAARRTHAQLANVQAPLHIDLSSIDWPTRTVGLPAELLAIACANVLHIAPWRVTEGLFEGAGRVLSGGGWLFIYGPFMRDGRHTAPSNAEFDTSLRSGNPEWGVRDVADLSRLAAIHGLSMSQAVEMPANNLMLVFKR